jgi:predicted RNA-binding protein
MCEANAYTLVNEKEILLMEAVDTVEPDEDGLRLTSIFGEQKFIKAHIHSLSLVNHKVLIKPNEK